MTYKFTIVGTIDLKDIDSDKVEIYGGRLFLPNGTVLDVLPGVEITTENGGSSIDHSFAGESPWNLKVLDSWINE